MFRAEKSIVSESRAQTTAPAAAGLVAALLLVDVWTDEAMTLGKHTPQKHFTLGCIENWEIYKHKTHFTTFAIVVWTKFIPSRWGRNNPCVGKFGSVKLLVSKYIHLYYDSLMHDLILPFCWFISQGSMMGRLTGAIHAEDTFHELAWSCGVPSIIPDGDLNTQTHVRLHSQHWSICGMYWLTESHLEDFHWRFHKGQVSVHATGCPAADRPAPLDHHNAASDQSLPSAVWTQRSASAPPMHLYTRKQMINCLKDYL